MTEMILDSDLMIREALERGMIDEAGDAIRALISADPNSQDAWLMRGVHDLIRGEFAEAETAFDRACSLGGNAREASLGLAQAQLGTKAYGDAWVTLSGLAQRETGDAEVLHWLLRAGLALENWAPLADHVEEYLSYKPEDDAARFAFASVLYRMDDVAEAQAQAEVLRERCATVEGLDELEGLLEPATLAASAA